MPGSSSARRPKATACLKIESCSSPFTDNRVCCGMLGAYGAQSAQSSGSRRLSGRILCSLVKKALAPETPEHKIPTPPLSCNPAYVQTGKGSKLKTCKPSTPEDSCEAAVVFGRQLQKSLHDELPQSSEFASRRLNPVLSLARLQKQRPCLPKASSTPQLNFASCQWYDARLLHLLIGP